MKLKIMAIWSISSLMIQLFIITISMSETINEQLTLVEPNIKTIGTGFPSDEAGLSAYVKVEALTANEMNETLKAFNSLVQSNSEYTLGTVDNYKIYVSFSGWVIAYLSQNIPSILFARPDSSGVNNLLKSPIAKVLNYINKSGEYKYYHFKYPEAKHMMIISEVVNNGYNQFYIDLPTEYTYYEASYLIYQNSTSSKGILKVDNNQIVILNNSKKSYGFYDINTTLTPDIAHKISIESSYNVVYGKTAIIYNK